MNILKIEEIVNQSEIKNWVTLKLIDFLTRNFPKEWKEPLAQFCTNPFMNLQKFPVD